VPYELLYKFQSGFLSGYSTTHQLIELYDNILLALDKKQITSITFADINKAKSNGPKTDPWGTPAFNSPVLDIASLITTRSFRLER
jgi:hypothetical protein